MKIRTPLAAALLMTAASATAQFTSPGLGGLTPAPSNSFSLAAAPVDDIVFKCSLVVPYRACTTAELNQREAIRASGTCPQPASKACVDYLMTQGDAAPVQLLGNQSNPSTANDEFFKKCGTVPYRLCTPEEEKQKAAWEAGKDKDKAKPDAKPEVNDNIQGPPQMVDMPKGGPEGKMLQYPSGRVEYCFDNSCTKTSGKPMTPSEAQKYLKEQYADQKQLANSINSGPSLTNAGNTSPDMNGLGLGGDNPGNAPTGGDPDSTRNPGGATRSPSGNNTSYNPSSNSSSGGDGGGTASSGDNSPRGLGAGIAGDQGRLSGGAGASSVSSDGLTANAGGDAVIKVDGAVAKAEAAKSGYTYTKIGAAAQNSDSLIKGGAAAFSPAPGGRAEEPPVDEKYLGKIQAAANQ